MTFDRLVYLLSESHLPPSQEISEEHKQNVARHLMHLQRKLSHAFTIYTKIHNSRGVLGKDFSEKMNNQATRLFQNKQNYYSFVEKHRHLIENSPDLLEKIDMFKKRNPLIFDGK